MADFPGQNSYVKLAKQALESYVKRMEIIMPTLDLPQEMFKQRAGVFVCIKKNGQLRGCIGTMFPTRENIAQEIIQNAINAGTRDPRFYPVSQEELNDLVYTVDVLEEPEPVESMKDLDIKKYGVIVTSGEKNGLILPDMVGIENTEQQLQIAIERAGIEPFESYKIQRFKVIRYH